MVIGMNKPLTYSSYLSLDGLLAQQKPLSGEHDEMLFIIIHQVYELWFKQLLHELRAVQAAFEKGDSARALAVLKRVLTILKTLVAQVDVIETMTPLSFNAFRARLDASSGFQSAQFRELEFLLGQRRAALVEHYPAGSAERERLAAALQAPALYDSFLRYLAEQNYQVPVEKPGIQDMLVQVYRDNGFPAQLCERLVDLDEGLQEWRYRHVKMVERTIGVKPGTGGSAGAAYLKSTLFQALFPDLWEIRSRL